MSGALKTGSTIGILGGGQLARMMAMAAARLGYRTVVLEPDPDCPAAQVCNEHLRAPYDDLTALDQLCERCDVVTYEFENVPASAAAHLSGKTVLRPGAKALEISQDRLTEKAFLQDAGIETAQFLQVDSDEDLKYALDQFGGDGVLKTRRLGYDGKGQRVFRSDITPSAIDGAYDALGSVPLILESLIDFQCEISVIAARGADGSMATYEPAINVHEDGILHSSTVPAGLPQDIIEKARDSALRLLEALDYVGVLGLELFVLESGEILANEFAPRVHNSGHWTEAACAVSQFEQHVRAVAGLPLGDCVRHSNCRMINLIGNDIADVPSHLEKSDTVVHLYGKRESRPGRKMGHVTTIRPRGDA